MDLTAIIKLLKDNPELLDTILTLVEKLANKVADGMIASIDRGVKQLISGILEEIRKPKV